jgi:hypothetical protein
MLKRAWLLSSGVVALAVAASGSVRAHHSGAMFDTQKSMTLAGTVRLFQWANPHCWIQLFAPAQDGKMVEWSVEMGSTTELYRSGWRPHTLQVGQKISVVVHPARDGSPGAAFVSAQDQDGSALGKVLKTGAP